jgi:hypothetical protein
VIVADELCRLRCVLAYRKPTNVQGKPSAAAVDLTTEWTGAPIFRETSLNHFRWLASHPDSGSWNALSSGSGSARGDEHARARQLLRRVVSGEPGGES